MKIYSSRDLLLFIYVRALLRTDSGHVKFVGYNHNFASSSRS